MRCWGLSLPEISHLSSPRVPAATASITAAVTVMLVALGPRFVRSSVESAVLAALSMTLCATVAVVELRRPRWWARILSAVGGLLIVCIGCAHAAAFVVALDRGLSIATTITLYALPVALLCCLIGGFAQLPRAWLPFVVPIVIGAPLVGWLSMQSDSWVTRAATGTVAATTAALSALASRRILRAPLRISECCALAALAGIGSIMVYAMSVALTPEQWWRDFASPLLLAYGFAGAALLAALAGLTFTPHTGEQRG